MLKILLMLTGLVSSAHAAEIQSARLSEIAIYPERSATAQVVSLNESRLSAEIAARVESISAEPGQIVAKGALLANLECTDYALATDSAAAALKASEARARLAELQLVRSQKLFEQKFISSSGLDTQQAQTEGARADISMSLSALKSAQNTQNKCTLYAPFPAVVMDRIAQVGEMVAPGTPLLTVRDLSRVEVSAEIQGKDLSIKLAKSISLVTPGGRYPLRLIRLSPAMNNSTRLLEARLSFVGPAATSGNSGRISWLSNQMHLPSQMVVSRNGQLGVFILKDNIPQFQPLLQAEEGRPVPVDLDKNTLIVTKGYETL